MLICFKPPQIFKSPHFWKQSQTPDGAMWASSRVGSDGLFLGGGCHLKFYWGRWCQLNEDKYGSAWGKNQLKFQRALSGWLVFGSQISSKCEYLMRSSKYMDALVGCLNKYQFSVRSFLICGRLWASKVWTGCSDHSQSLCHTPAAVISQLV